MSIEVTIPLRTTNPLNGSTGNSRVAAAIRSRKRAEHRAVARMAVSAELKRTPGSGVFTRNWITVTLTRVSPGTMDTDGLAASFKGIRDGIADAIGIDDGDPRITFKYAQEKSKRFFAGRLPASKYCVRIRVECEAAKDATT